MNRACAAPAASGGSSDRALLAACAALFAASAAATVAWCGSMASTGGMPMPGGWEMSMAWMRMPGQTWPGAAAAFVGMWALMMVAMMLPALVPALRNGRAGATALVALGYFAVWSALGIVVYPVGIVLAEAAMASDAVARAMPAASGFVVLAAGLLQLTAWKTRRLACCRSAVSPPAARPWRHGIRLGLDCVLCCAGPTAVLLALGVMDVAVMSVVAVAISLERVAGPRAAAALGIVGIGAGLFLVTRSVLPA